MDRGGVQIDAWADDRAIHALYPVQPRDTSGRRVDTTARDRVTGALERGEGIEIRGYGSFTVRHYEPYMGRNPRTGKDVAVPPKRLPFFKVGKELKLLVNQGAEDDDA